MRYDEADDLRMLAFDHFRDGAGVHPLENFNTLGAAGRRNAREHAACLVFAKSLDEHAADVSVRPQPDACLRLDDGQELVKHHIDRALIHLRDRIHRTAKLLNLARGEVLHDFRGLVFAKEQHQDGALLRS